MSDYITRPLFLLTSVAILAAVCLPFGMPAHAQAKKEWVIVIDPGHGGRDPGAIGGNIKEKDITLAMALKLGKQLSALENTKVIYTRDTDETVDLYKRPKKANESKADLFISIHCNSVESAKPYGAETWVMGLHRSKANLEVAKAENSVILLEDDYQTKYDGFDPTSPEAEIIFSLYQNTYLDQSVDFASLVQMELRTNAQRFDRGVKQAGFLVLYKINMPGILVEAGFLSNENERKFLSSDAGQNAIATSVFNAVINYREKMEGAKPRVITPEPDIAAANNPKNTDNPQSVTKINDPVNIKKTDPQANVKSTPEPKPESIIPAESKTPELYYSVQLLTSSRKRELSDTLFNGIKDLHIYSSDGAFRYVAGYFITQELANAYKNELTNTPFHDAFVVAFYKGKRISVSEAKQLNK